MAIVIRGAVVGRFVSLFGPGMKVRLRAAFVASVALASLDFASLLLLLPVFTNLISAGQKSTIGGPLDAVLSGLTTDQLLVIAISMLITRSVLGFAFRFWWTRQVAQAELALSARLMRAYAFAPYAFHLRRNSSDLLSRAVAHVNLATTSGLNGITLLVADATTVVALAAGLFIANALAGLVVCGYLAMVGAVFIFVSRRYVSTQTRRFGDEVAQVYRRGATVLRGVRELTVAGGREVVLEGMARSRGNMVRAQRNMLILTDVPRLILDIALYSAIMLALLFVLGSGSQRQSLPLVALYVVAGLRIVPALGRALGSLTQARTGLEMGGQVAAELAEVEGLPREAPRPAGALPREGSLSLEGVSFSYESDAVICDLDLEVPFGCQLAVVGPSGSGKSTLLGLILGLLSPTAGAVTYGGEPVGLSDPAWLAHVGYVPQEVFVLDDTVLANVTLGHDERDVDRAWISLERASLADIVRRMPEGLDSPLGENGSRLSVGQRQRLGLARALYRAPSVLILDEPTAALDPVTEGEVMTTINQLRGSMTLIIVAHRLDTIAQADAILRLDGGVAQIISLAEVKHVAEGESP